MKRASNEVKAIATGTALRLVSVNTELLKNRITEMKNY